MPGGLYDAHAEDKSIGGDVGVKGGVEKHCLGGEAERNDGMIRTQESIESLRSLGLSMALASLVGDGRPGPSNPQPVPQTTPETPQESSTDKNTSTEATYRIPTIEREISAGIGVDALDSDGKTSLFTAVINGKLDMVRTIIDCNASVDACVGKKVIFNVFVLFHGMSSTLIGHCTLLQL